ncbi:MAG: hypothetical protein KME56_03290 [Candidatus Thiodiazotropha sp. (ex Ctena orbiculata)]|nr:hypothetical protein [Candidatus Thiodiazotropha taylori]MBT2995642.1 hypothetical protein [Candidatus Thiodiazotropha taylori]MBT2999404.1 hypothetical protein [Candidatus Thiodiazotropha taylori]MBV2106497.1 hypothetical protein [Candidatus Thiodiazotropha taylori]MBV2110316.1 hypothetical protein [Candidatus Thiodiazotropha taylori]
MKWLFFILLLANLGMFILIYPQQADKSDEKGLPDIGELFLYKEVAELSGDAGDVDASGTAAIPESSPQSGEEILAEDTESQIVAQRQEAESGPQLTGESESVSAQEESSTAETEVTAAEEAKEQEPASEEVAVCKTIGYLQSRSDAEIVSVRLRALGLKPELQSETSNEQAGIWVLVPPQASRRDAVEVANRLERDGISDLWRFTSGELVHAISLGLFRNEERAEARRKEISDLGYEVIIKPRYRQATKYWLYFQQRTPATLTEKGWRELLENFPDIEVEETACR